MILLSAHQDTVRDAGVPAFYGGKHAGLLDNWIGILVTYLAIYRSPVLRELVEEETVRVFHHRGEEWMRSLPRGLVDDVRSCPSLVIVVDVAAGSRYYEETAVIENVANVPNDVVSDLRETLASEGWRVPVRLFTGNPEEEDEAWLWRDEKVPVFSFIVPVFPVEKDGTHHSVCEIDTDDIDLASKALVRVINIVGDRYLRAPAPRRYTLRERR